MKEIIEQGFTERKSSPFLIRTMTDIEYNNSIILLNETIETPANQPSRLTHRSFFKETYNIIDEMEAYLMQLENEINL